MFAAIDREDPKGSAQGGCASAMDAGVTIAGYISSNKAHLEKLRCSPGAAAVQACFLGPCVRGPLGCAGPHYFLELHWGGSGQWCCSSHFSLRGSGPSTAGCRCGAIGERALCKLQFMWCAVDPCTTLSYLHPAGMHVPGGAGATGGGWTYTGM
jgi:hypothetical protein